MARNARRDQRERIHRLGAIREQYFRFYFELRHERAKESLENWLGRVVCGAKEQQQPQQQDDLEENSSLGLESAVNEELSEENTLAKKPVVGKHVFNCYSAAASK